MAPRLYKIHSLAIAALLCFGVSILPSVPSYISSLTGSVLCFVLTGVAVASAMLPERVSGVARLTAIVAGSLGVGIAGGLILNLIPAGITRSSWLVYGVLTTLVAYGIARLRGATDPVDWHRSASPLTWASCAKLSGAALLAASAIIISVAGPDQRAQPFTEVWLVPTGQTQSAVGATGAVFGMKSHELSDHEFTVVMNTGARTTTSRVTLAPNQEWTQAVPVEGARAEASVYRGGLDEPAYRTVWIVSR